MYCKNCGKPMNDNAAFCPNCGVAPERTPSGPVSFIDAVKSFFTHYADFSGRSRRSEYWWVYLFNMIVAGILGMIDVAALSTLWTLAVLIPGIALGVRRLHDTGRSGWWLLISLVPLVGAIVLIVFVCTDSAPANQYGPSPKY